jgi:multiple sugar transport system substrate-binding protein
MFFLPLPRPACWRLPFPTQSRGSWLAVTLAMAGVLLSGCGRRDTAGPRADGRTEITVWAHHGKPEEWKTIQTQVERFNTSQTEIFARLIEIAEAGYDTQVQSAAASSRLPDVLEFDGPMLANYAWKGYLQPLPSLGDELRADLLPSLIQQGTYAGKLYAVGTFDSGLGLFAHRRLLEEAGVRVPSGVADAWTIDEFDDLLARLAAREKAAGGDGQVLDLKRDYRGEWWTYGFYASLVSAGADLIDRSAYRSATGTLNSPAAAAMLGRLQRWFRSGYVDPNTDDRSFTDGRVALSWAGHWEYPRYHEALGDQLVLLPLPDFGRGSRTGQGSWAWGVTRASPQPAAAARFIEFLLQPAEIEAIVAANGAVPARRSVIARSALYRSGAPLGLFADQLGRSAVPRPVTPAYPVITSAFQEVMAKVIEGGEVQPALDAATKTIDQDIRDNEGYASR